MRHSLEISSGQFLRGWRERPGTLLIGATKRGAFPVDLMCRSLGVGSSGFYAWLKRPESPRRRDNLRLLTEIKAVYRRSRKTMAVLESMQS